MSDWEDDPIQTRPGGEASNGHTSKYRVPVDNGADDDGGWGDTDNTLTWAQEDKSKNKPHHQYTTNSKRFEDEDETLWGGGSGSKRQNNSYSIRRGRGGRPYSDRGSKQNERPRNNNIGFGYDSSGYTEQNSDKYQNGYAAKKFFSGNLNGKSGSSNDDWSNQRNGPSSYKGEKGSCYKCGQVGHIARSCRSEGDAKSNGRGNECFKCGENGHFARECTNSSSRHQTKAHNGGGKYIPQEEDDFDVLYKNGISTGINFERYGNIPCEVSGFDAPHQIISFEESELRDLLMKNIERSGYKLPTPVQKYALPIILKGRDLMGCAQTGSGKTAAFLLPLLNNLLEQGFDTKSDELPQLPEAIIVAPTRELAIQIKDQSRKFANNSPLKSVCIYGGTSVMHQINQIRRGVNVLVATPGRLLDFLDKGHISFQNIKFFVLDEADRMLDMGFMPDIERMESHATMPRKGKRQTLMFSATFPDAIQRAASNFLDNYLFLKVGVVGSANSDITQSIFRCHKFEKRDTLLSIFKDLKNIEKTLIFVQQKKMTDFLASYLCQNEVKSTTIHGDRLQEEREEALRQFTRGKMPVLVATDCAARGLDIPDVAHVINYDLPKSMDEYVHRIGRTGRVGNTGRASSFYDPEDDAQMAKNLVKVLVESNQEVPEWLQKESEKQMMSGSYGGFGGYSGKDIRQKSKNDSTLYDDPYDLNRQFATKPSDPLEEDEPWE